MKDVRWICHKHSENCSRSSRGEAVGIDAESVGDLRVLVERGTNWPGRRRLRVRTWQHHRR